MPHPVLSRHLLRHASFETVKVITLQDDEICRIFDTFGIGAGSLISGFSIDKCLSRGGLMHKVPSKSASSNHPSWLPAFLGGISSIDIDLQCKYAFDVISTVNSWSEDDIIQLAKYFCRAGCMFGGASCTAPFSQMVYLMLHDRCGEAPACSFMYHLRHYVHYALTIGWSSKDRKSIGYHNTPSYLYVRCAISIAIFMGDLFTHQNGHREIANSLDMLLNGLISIEHLEAVRKLVLHAGPTFWCNTALGGTLGNKAVNEFIASLQRGVYLLEQNINLGYSVSVLGNKFGSEDLHLFADEIVRTVRGWEGELMPTPKPLTHRLLPDVSQSSRTDILA